MQTQAPNFRGRYPLAGDRIGPAWRDAWTMLDQESWTDGRRVASILAVRHGLTEHTVKNLLRAARAAGILESRLRYPPGRNRVSAYYRVKPVAIRTGRG